MLKDLADKYALMDYNCAEALLHGANEYYQLDLTDKEMKLVGGFGGGMQVGDICGGLNAAICVIAERYIKDHAHEDRPGLRSKVSLLIRTFEKEMGSRQCKDIKPKYFSKEMACRVTIGKSADILEKVIAQIDEQIANEAAY